eukprot:GHVR01139147.1.p3 GENE.GHVR01139147.1~~GHVR01139147.1.p3  ORF type:complete len:105 (+),score=59.94 GHVR01139147.1:260-574(+)
MIVMILMTHTHTHTHSATHKQDTHSNDSHTHTHTSHTSTHSEPDLNTHTDNTHEYYLPLPDETLSQFIGSHYRQRCFSGGSSNPSLSERSNARSRAWTAEIHER